MQKESVLFFSFPSESTFLRLAVARISVASAERDTVRGTNKRAKRKIYLSFFIDADVADIADIILSEI